MTSASLNKSVGRLRTQKKAKRIALGGLRTVTILVVITVLVAPIAWMIMASLKNNVDIINPKHTFNFEPTLKNYFTVFEQQNFGPVIVNSLIVALGSTALSLLIGVPAAYGIARYKAKNTTAFLLMARVIPGVSLLVPWYFLFAQMRLVGTYTVLILAHVFVTMPLVVAIMAGFFEGIPNDLEEAALVDGSSKIGAFVRIILPLSIPGIATSAILAIIFSWNNFLFALVLASQETRTLPVAIVNFQTYASIDWGGLMAASVVVTLPVMLIALFAQKYVVSGLTAGATKG